MRLLSIFCIWLTIHSVQAVEAGHPKPLTRREHMPEESKVHVAFGSNGELAAAGMKAKHPVAKDGKVSKEPTFDVLDDAEENDVALDELEAMTIQAALAGKAPPPRRRRAPPRRRRDPPRRRRAPPPVNCVWGAWVEGSCSKTCGGGKRTDTRTKDKSESNGGTCEGESTLPNQECNDEDCPTTTTLMTTVKAAANHMGGVCLLPYVLLSMLVVLNFQ